MQEDSTVDPTPPANPSGNQPSLWQRLEKNQKIFLVVLVCFALAMFALWSVQLKKGLFEPIRRTTVQQQGSPAEEAPTARLDTDGDGLRDEEELGTYHTSPYLEDTDSDGFKDGEELRRGSDPNCPEGRSCAVVPAQAGESAAATTTAPAAIDANPAPTGTSTSQASAALPSQPALSEAEMRAMLEGKMTAPDLRQAMLKAGADPKLLGQLSDEELLKSYQEALKSQ